MGEQRSGTEAALDRLYGLPLEEFTKERNALATRLKREGDAEAAAGVRALAKPSLVAWTINQLARRERAQLNVLLSAVDELRAAQGAALAGSPGELRQAQERVRAAVQALARSARPILSEAGRATSDATIARVSASLAAAAADPEARPLLEQGRLEGEVESVGFAAVSGLPTGASSQKISPRPKAGDELAERRRQKAAARARVHELRKELQGLRRREREAEEAAQKLERDARSARKLADRARQEIDRVERALEEAEPKT